jgi:glyoxylase-like metal-dependent hydrolase (beta-lactamase superfamily II)
MKHLLPRWIRAIKAAILLLLILPFCSASVSAGDDSVLIKLLQRYGQLPPAFQVEWRGQNVMLRQSPNPGPPFATTPFRVRYKLDFEQGGYAMRYEEAGMGHHREQGHLLKDNNAWTLDYQAGTARPETAAFGQRATDLAMMLPALLARLLAQNPQNWTAFSLGAIRYQTGDAGYWDIGYDPVTGRIRMLRHTTTDGNGGEVVMRLVFEDEIDIGGAWIPQTITEWTEAEQSRQWTLLKFGPLEADHQSFELPDRFNQIERRPVDTFGQRAESLAIGLHWVGSGVTRQLFVEFGTYLVAADACGGDTRARLDTIARRVPGKPVRYVLVTHHHEDHLHGLEEHVRAGARVIASPSHRETVFAYLQKHGIDPRTVGFQWVSDRYQLTDGLRRLVIRDIQTLHSEHMLVMFLPEDRMAFVSDLWVAHDTAPTVATPDMITLNAIISVLEPLTRRIVDSHSAIVLETKNLRAAVQRAQEKNLGMEREIRWLEQGVE